MTKLLRGEQRRALAESGWFIAGHVEGRRVTELVQSVAAVFGGWCGPNHQPLDATFELGLRRARALG